MTNHLLLGRSKKKAVAGSFHQNVADVLAPGPTTRMMPTFQVKCRLIRRDITLIKK